MNLIELGTDRSEYELHFGWLLLIGPVVACLSALLFPSTSFLRFAFILATVVVLLANWILAILFAIKFLGFDIMA